MKTKTKELVKGSFIIIGFIAFMLLVGSLGALETGSIEVRQATKQCAVFITVVVICFIGHSTADKCDITIQDCLVKHAKGKAVLIEAGEVKEFRRECNG